MAQKFRRRKYLVATRFQLKYVGLILLFMFIIAAVSGYTVFYTAWTILGEKLAQVVSVVICHQERFSQDRLAFAMWNGCKQIGLWVENQVLHGAQIGAETLDRRGPGISLCR